MTSACTTEIHACTTVPRIAASRQASLLLRLARTVSYSILIFYKRIKRRRKFIALLNYDDHMIDDMGLTRPLIEEASRLPLRSNAALIAREWARQK